MKYLTILLICMLTACQTAPQLQQQPPQQTSGTCADEFNDKMAPLEAHMAY